MGVGKTRFGAFADRDLRSLALEAAGNALQDAGLEAGAVEAFYLGNFAGPSFTGQSHLAPYIAGAMGSHDPSSFDAFKTQVETAAQRAEEVLTRLH